MDKLKRARHQLIWQVLEQFNTEFLVENNILFGGGTRIALELNEFRESTDIDFFCAGAASYRQVRLQAEAISLGQVLQPDHSLVLLAEMLAGDYKSPYGTTERLRFDWWLFLPICFTCATRMTAGL